MPRKPIDCGCPCEPIVVKNTASDAKLVILEDKLVPKDLQEFTEKEFEDNSYFYVDNNGSPTKASTEIITDKQKRLQEVLESKINLGGITVGKTYEAGTSLEEILRDLLMPNQPVLSSIRIVTPPSKVTYSIGEVFNPAGMVVEAVYSDAHTAVITNYSYSPATPLTLNDNNIVVSYTEENVTKIANQPITVVESGVKIYKGVVDELPNTSEEITALILDESKSKPTLLTSGYVWKNVSPNNQYFIIAISDEYNISCYDIKTNGYSAACEIKEVEGYSVYHVGVKSTDTYRVEYSFEEA